MDNQRIDPESGKIIVPLSRRWGDMAGASSIGAIVDPQHWVIFIGLAVFFIVLSSIEHRREEKSNPTT
jgi:hypothetical protein